MLEKRQNRFKERKRRNLCLFNVAFCQNEIDKLGMRNLRSNMDKLDWKPRRGANLTRTGKDLDPADSRM